MTINPLVHSFIIVCMLISFYKVAGLVLAEAVSEQNPQLNKINITKYRKAIQFSSVQLSLFICHMYGNTGLTLP